MNDDCYIRPHQTAPTSREHFKTFVADGLYAVILAKLREDATRDFCIADLADELDLERSTVSARLNELKHQGQLEYTETKKSKCTGIKSMHFRIKLSETLF